MRPTRIVAPRTIISALLLLIALGASVYWQAQGRAHQQIDIGSASDDGAALNFHEAETSTSNPSLTFRWSKDASEVRLWTLGRNATAILTLRMFPPESEPRRVTLSAADQSLGTVILVPGVRVYRALLRSPGDQELAIGIASVGEVRSKDSRGVVAGLDRLAVDRLPVAFPRDLVRELWLAPLLPAGLLLLALAALLLSLPRLLIGGIPALALVVLVVLALLMPEARLRLASYVFAIGLTAVAALLLLTLLRRLPRLSPNSDRRAYNWLLALFIATVVLAFRPTIKSDGMGYYVYLRSLTIDGDINFGNDYRGWPDQQNPDQHVTPQTVTGYYVNYFSIGPALLWSPLYGAAHAIVLGGRALGQPWQADGYAPIYFVLTTFGSALAGLVLMLVGYRICRRWVAPPTALLAVVTAFFGSNLLYYTLREGGFAHGLSAATATVYVLVWLRLEERPSIWRWAALGAAAGLMLLTYWVAGLVLLLPVFTAARLLIAAFRAAPAQRAWEIARLLVGMSVAAVLLVVVFSPQMIAWQLIYGAFLTVPQGSGFVTPQAFRGLDMLFAPLHGLLPWTPALFVGGFSLALLWRRNRYLAAALITALAAYFLYNAWLPDWHGSGAFGLRRLTLLAPWCMLGLALLFDALRRWHRLLPAIPAALMIGWATLVLIRYDLDLIPHNPGALRKLTPLGFYLSREIFPLWAVPGWINNSYMMHQVRELSAMGWNGQPVAIVIVMIAATWAVMAVAKRVTRDAGRAM
ncbi:MAG: hypothetical protein ABIV47_01615 [Roseiflexaceae bacterium]